MKLNKLQKSSTHRIIIYGAPKTGKSQLAGKLAEYYNIIWVDMENGHEVLFNGKKATIIVNPKIEEQQNFLMEYNDIERERNLKYSNIEKKNFSINNDIIKIYTNISTREDSLLTKKYK
jgi:phosphoenolpyruvate-protein kinase (PTS system EI component)